MLTHLRTITLSLVFLSALGVGTARGQTAGDLMGSGIPGGSSRTQIPTPGLVGISFGNSTITMGDPSLKSIPLGDAGSSSILDRERQVKSEYTAKQQQIDQWKAKIDPHKIEDLEKQKEQELEEYRQGFFCSGCGRTRSDILAHGEEFPHPGQHVVKATQGQIDAKTGEWNVKIDQAKHDQEEYSVHIQELQSQQKQLSADSARIYLDWMNELRQEDLARATNWNHDIDQAKRELAATRAAIRQDNLKLDAEKMQGSRGSQEALDGYRRSLLADSKHRENISERAGHDFAQHMDQQKAFEQAMLLGTKEMGGIISDVGGPLVVPATAQMGTLSVTLSAPGSPVSIDLGANNAGLSVNLGALKASLAMSCDFLRQECKLDVGMSATLPFVGTVSAGMRKTTSFDGTMTDTPYAKAGGLDLKDLMKDPVTPPPSTPIIP